jgi:N4-gp56 family major capsid protein
MATTSYGLNSNETVKLWSRKLFRESIKSTWLSKFMGEGSDAVIQVMDDLAKGPGDRVRNILRVTLDGDGVEGDATLEGNEEAITTYTDDFVINQLRHAVRSAGKMNEQRIPFSIREEARMALTDWFADRIDTCLFNQLAGNTAATDTRFTAHNATVAPDSDHRVAPGNTAAASLSASQVFTLELLDLAVEKAKTLSPLIRPIKQDGKDYYVCFLHPYQVTSLRTDAATAGNWFDLQKASLQGGDRANNPIFTGALGVYNGVVLHEANRVPLTSTSTSSNANTRRAIFCGAQAGVVAFGRDNGANRMTWTEDLFDYGNQFGVAAGLIWGAKKNVFNSADFGTIVIDTYAAAATAV